MNSVTDYTIKYSKTGDPIPVINGVHLHSIYNPQKEAETFLEKHKTIVDEKSKLLLLGLGFGHHLKAVVDYCTSKNISKEIIVVEPNLVVFRDYLKLNGANLPDNIIDKCVYQTDSNVTCYVGYKTDDLYNDQAFISFLCGRPGVLYHAVSFNLYQEYFKDFLKYSSPKTIESIRTNCKTPFLINGLSFYPNHMTFDEALVEKSNNKNLKFETFLKIFDSIN